MTNKEQLDYLESLGVSLDDIYVCDNCGYENELENGWDFDFGSTCVAICPHCGIEKYI